MLVDAVCDAVFEDVSVSIIDECKGTDTVVDARNDVVGL